MKFLFPRNELDKKKVADMYLEQFRAAKLHNCDCFLFDYDEFELCNGDFLSNVPELEDGEAPIILKSYMLSIANYERLYEILKDKGYLLINTPEQYRNCHHFPESYDYTKEYSSKAIFIKNWDAEILQDISDFFEGKSFILKDYVKSEKHHPDKDIFLMPGGISGEDLLNRVERFVEARGKLFSVGLVFKEFVDLKKYEGGTNEWRLFFFKKKLVSAYQNTELSVKHTHPHLEEDSFVQQVAYQIDSNFFTIDIAEKEDGGWMIIETGDGQVSDLKDGQNAFEFLGNMMPKQVD